MNISKIFQLTEEDKAEYQLLIDKLYREKRDLVKKAKRKTIAFAKIEISNYGP